MLKYALVGIVLATALAFGGIAIISQINEPAEAGIAPVVAVTVDESGVSPASLHIDRDRLVELRVTNAGRGARRVLLQHPAVESLPVSQDPRHGATNVPLPGLSFVVPSGGTAAMLLRVGQSGTYDVSFSISDSEVRSHNLTLVVE